jgi:hypothetical protein
MSVPICTDHTHCSERVARHDLTVPEQPDPTAFEPTVEPIRGSEQRQNGLFLQRYSVNRGRPGGRH